MEYDNVNHPAHYNTGKYESIDVMVETQGVDAVKNFCICNAFKYIYRHRFKNGVEDIKKAVWYLNKYIELNEKEWEMKTILVPYDENMTKEELLKAIADVMESDVETVKKELCELKKK